MCSIGNSRFRNRISSIYTIPSLLYILSAAWLAPRNVSFPPSRPYSPGPTAKARTPPPQALRPPLPHLPHPHLAIRTSRDPSRSRTSQFTFRTPYPSRGPPILEKIPFPLLTPAVLRLRLDLSRTLLLSPFAKVYVPPSDDNLVQPVHGMCCMITIIICLFPLHVILRTFQTPIIIIEFLNHRLLLRPKYVRAFETNEFVIYTRTSSSQMVFRNSFNSCADIKEASLPFDRSPTACLKSTYSSMIFSCTCDSSTSTVLSSSR